jgi:membrane protein required for colicin V production
MIGPLTYLDAALLAVALISGLLAMYRGFTREMLSIVAWAVAAGATLYFVLYQKALAQQIAAQVGAPLPVAQIGAGGVIFLVVLIIVHLITVRISDTILDSRVGMIDRLLGFGFGLVRGFILIVIPYMFFEWLVPNYQAQYPWINRSVSLPYIKSTGKAIETAVSPLVPAFKLPGEQQG